MAHSESYDVIIAGAGPAAMIAGVGLARSGLRVVLLGFDDRPAPQASHVHLFRDALWPCLFELVPELQSQLRSRNSALLPLAAVDAQTGQAKSESVSPVSRSLLDSQLRRVTGSSAVERRRTRFRNARHQDGSWSVETTGGTHLRAAWLIDATGTARGTARAVGAALGGPLPLDEADADFTYATWRFKGVPPPGRDRGHPCWSSEFRIGAVVAPDENSWLLTLQSVEPFPDPLPGSPAEILETVGDTQLARICGNSKVLGKPGRWTTAPISRIDLQPAASVGLPWFPMGDALVTTPPVLGWGFEQIVEQCSAVVGCQLAGDLAAAFEPLTEASRVRFEQSIFATARRSRALFQATAAPPSRQFQGIIHVESSA